MDAASVTLTVGDYVLYSIMGVCVVFFALALLIAVIKLITMEPKKEAQPAAAAAGAAGAAAAAPADAKADRPLAPGTAGDLKLYDTDPRDAAMIMAIVADEMKKPLNELRFISIKECK